jgi:hypothetical protein
MPSKIQVRRRLAIKRALALMGGVAGGLGLASVPSAAAQTEQLTVSGGGVNVKQMPAAEGDGTVPMRESFSFDAHYAQCIVEDNAAAFAMDTHDMGRVLIPEHSFFMAMYSNEMAVVSVKGAAGGKRVAMLAGQLGCATEAGTGEITVGSREASEPAFFEIEAVDGGHGGGAAGDSFTFTVYFDPAQAPVNHAIFGPKATFTGQMVAGEVTIDAPVTLPMVA